MKKNELIRAYGSIKASDELRDELYSACVKGRVVMTERKKKPAYFAVVSGAAAVLCICIGVSAINSEDTLYSPREEVNIETADLEAERQREEESQHRLEEERRREAEERLRLEEEQKRAEEERLRLEEEQRRAEEEHIRLEEERKRAAENQHRREKENFQNARLKAIDFTWVCPEVRSISDGYGGENSEIFHKGLDIFGEDCEGKDVVAAASGTVLTAGYDEKGYGNRVVIDHGDGIVTTYAHLSDITVSEGDEVQAGSLIGHIGSTGYAEKAHLHFELSIDGEYIDPRGYVNVPQN